MFAPRSSGHSSRRISLACCGMGSGVVVGTLLQKRSGPGCRASPMRLPRCGHPPHLTVWRRGRSARFRWLHCAALLMCRRRRMTMSRFLFRWFLALTVGESQLVPHQGRGRSTPLANQLCVCPVRLS